MPPLAQDSLTACPAEIRYDLSLDALRAKARASFIDLDDKSERKFNISDRGTHCLQETFMMEVGTHQPAVMAT